MSGREGTDSHAVADTHAATAEAFVERANSRFGSAIVGLYVFGSTVRGEARGLASDVDVLVVLAEDADNESVAEGLRDLAYDVMLEYGPVVELHVLSATEFERAMEEGDPFVSHVVDEGRAYV